MQTTLNSYLDQISSTIDTYGPNMNVNNIDILAAFYLGMIASENTNPDEFLIRLQDLFNKKIALKFVDRLVAVSGGTSMTPKLKEQLIQDINPMAIITELNNITGKTEATKMIQPFSQLLLNPSFHQDFLDYETQAHNALVGSLIQTLASTSKKIPSSFNANKESNPTTLKNLYKGSNVGKIFVSVDLRQANWTALRYWDNSLPEWSVYVNGVIPDGRFKSFFANSKNFRQITLGVAMKKLGIVSKIEATQVMLINNVYNQLDPTIGEPFSKSNDEIVFEWFWQRRDVTKWFQSAIRNPDIKVTIMQMLEETYDGCYVFSYEELGKNPKSYTLLRVYTPEKVESRMK